MRVGFRVNDRLFVAVDQVVKGQIGENPATVSLRVRLYFEPIVLVLSL